MRFQNQCRIVTHRPLGCPATQWSRCTAFWLCRGGRWAMGELTVLLRLASQFQSRSRIRDVVLLGVKSAARRTLPIGLTLADVLFRSYFLAPTFFAPTFSLFLSHTSCARQLDAKIGSRVYASTSEHGIVRLLPILTTQTPNSTDYATPTNPIKSISFGPDAHAKTSVEKRSFLNLSNHFSSCSSVLSSPLHSPLSFAIFKNVCLTLSPRPRLPHT